MTKTKPKAWPHQAEGTAWCRSLEASYLDVKMGGGKSRTLIDFIEQIEAQTVLVVCPKSVVADVWPSQFETWGEREWHVAAWTTIGASSAVRLKRTEKLMFQAGFEGKPFAMVINYDAFRAAAAFGWIHKRMWDVIAYDEMQKLKSPTGKTSKAAARMVSRSKRRVGMSGTPLPNNPLDIFGQARALEPSLFGTSWYRFRAKYAIMGGFEGRQVVRYQNQEEMTQLMGTIMFSPDPDSIDLGLPEATHQEITVDLSPKARKLYDALTSDVIEAVNGGVITAQNGLVRLLRMQQLCSGLAVVDKPLGEDATDEELGAMLRGELQPERESHVVCTAKREALADLLDQTDEPFVVFGQFRADADNAKWAAAEVGASYAELSGQADDLAHWKAGGARVLFVQIASGAAGIDLTRARYIAYTSTGFDMGNYLQSLARVQRPGQKLNVTYYHIRARDSVDTYVAQALARKEDLVEATLAMVADSRDKKDPKRISSK